MRASASAGSRTPCIAVRSKAAPRLKKNTTRKKSRRGLRLSAMKREMGCVATAMPAMKAPISGDSPSDSDNSAMPRHQPIARRKMYSWIVSKRASRRVRTKREKPNAKIRKPGSVRPRAAARCQPSLLPVMPCNKRRIRIAIRSCSSRTLIMISPVCW